jgi:hypothetical protein
MMFNKDLILLILEGKKTMTSRDKALYVEGDITNLMANKDYSKETGLYIRITKVYQKTLEDFTSTEAHKEGFQTLGEFHRYWIENIEPWNPKKTVWVHEFETIRKDKPEPETKQELFYGNTQYEKEQLLDEDDSDDL